MISRSPDGAILTIVTPSGITAKVVWTPMGLVAGLGDRTIGWVNWQAAVDFLAPIRRELREQHRENATS